MTPAKLRERLTKLETAIAAAAAGAERTAQRLSTARKNVAKLAPVPGIWRNENLAVVYEVGGALREDFSGLQAGVGTADAAHVQAGQSTAAADDLAIAVRAASNPTPKSAQVTPGAAPEDPRRDRSEGRGPGQGRDV